MKILRPRSKNSLINNDAKGVNRTLGQRHVLNTRRQKFDTYDRATPPILVTKETKKRFPRTMFMLVPFVLAAIALAVIWNCILAGGAQVVIANPGNLQLRSEAEYNSAAVEALKGSWRNRTKFTLDKQKVAASILTQIPEAEEAIVGPLLFGQNVRVTLTIDAPVMILQTASQNLIVGSSGKVLGPANDKNINSKAPKISDQSGLEPAVGDQVFGADTVSRILLLLKDSEGSKLRVSQAILPASPYELDIRYEGKPYMVKYSLSRDMREQLGSYLAVQAKLEREGIAPAAYIDVRVEERAYYK